MSAVTCGWPLGHRDKHKGSWCSCVCHRPKDHAGKHHCEREVSLAPDEVNEVQE